MAPPAGSSGSDIGGEIDDKKRRRMASNRESARRSRQRKQQHLDELIHQIGRLKRENEEFAKKIGEISAVYAAVDGQNTVLNAEKHRLAARLESLESIIETTKVFRGPSGNGNGGVEEYLYEVNSDPMMKPWQLSYPSSMPIFASSGLRCFNLGASI